MNCQSIWNSAPRYVTTTSWWFLHVPEMQTVGLILQDSAFYLLGHLHELTQRTYVVSFIKWNDWRSHQPKDKRGHWIHGLVEPASCVKSVDLFPTYLHNARFYRTYIFSEWSKYSGWVVFFNALWASDLGTIIFILPSPIGAEGIVFGLSIRPCIYPSVRLCVHASRDLVNALDHKRMKVFQLIWVICELRWIHAKDDLITL